MAKALVINSFGANTNGQTNSDPPIEITLPTSGTALAEGTIYNVQNTIGTYQFVPPTTWASGTFTTSTSVNITFSSDSKFLQYIPVFESNKTYEFNVFNGVWCFVEVVTV